MSMLWIKRSCSAENSSIFHFFCSAPMFLFQFLNMLAESRKKTWCDPDGNHYYIVCTTLLSIFSSSFSEKCDALHGNEILMHYSVNDMR